MDTMCRQERQVGVVYRSMRLAASGRPPILQDALKEPPVAKR